MLGKAGFPVGCAPVSDWLITLEGTEAGHQAALMLALLAAFLHAVFGALQKDGTIHGCRAWRSTDGWSC